MDGNKTVTVHFPIKRFTLTTAASEGGEIVPAAGVREYDCGTTVPVSAQPDAEHNFTGFTGDLTGTTTPQNLVMNGPKSVTANFEPKPPVYTLTTSAGQGGSISPAPPSHEYPAGTVVTVWATNESGYEFAGFSGDLAGTVNPQEITMDANKAVTATFAPILTLSADPGGTISSEPSAGPIALGTQATVSATPDGNHDFTGFEGALSGTQTPQTLSMNGPKSVRARFALKRYTLTTSVAGPCGSISPATGGYDTESTVPVTAIEGSNCHFIGFSGDLSGPTNPQNVVVASNVGTVRSRDSTILRMSPKSPSTTREDRTMRNASAGGACAYVT
jgi:hypothetical protein